MLLVANINPFKGVAIFLPDKYQNNPGPMSFNKLWLIIGVLHLWGLLLNPSIGLAAPMPKLDNKISTIVAREQPIAIFLQDLLGQADVPVWVSPSIQGKVNGSFNGSIKEVFEGILRAFGLVSYYDGAVLHVYPASNVTSRIFATIPQVAKRVRASAREMRLGDANHTLKVLKGGSLMVTGSVRYIEQVAELLAAAERAQAAQPSLGFEVFYLRYAWAHDIMVNFGGRQIVLPGLASILRSMLTSSSDSQIQMTSEDSVLPPTIPGLRKSGLSKPNERLGLPDNNSRDKSNQAFDINTTRAQANNQLLTSGTTSLLPFGDSQQVRIEADRRLNAIIIRDAPERMGHYKKLIKLLDIEPQSIEIEATIIDLNTSRLQELGINWRWQNNDDEVLFGRGDESDLRLRPSGDVTPEGRGGFVSMVLGDNAKFVARISALEAEGAARVVSSPQVLTLSNVEALFDTSSTFYVRVAGEDEVDLFNISAGTSLRVTPHVFKDDEAVRIKLLVSVEDGTLTSQEVDQIPVVQRSAINTQALINAGESLLIGGLVRESSSEVEDRVPLLWRIPLVGNLFRYKSDEGQRIERMFLISPRLVPSNASKLAKALEVENNKTQNLVEEQVKVDNLPIVKPTKKRRCSTSYGHRKRHSVFRCK